MAVLAHTLGMDLQLEAQETNVGPFRADILCKNTAGGAWVLIENQLERTDHTHLGQLLTYAAGLHAVTVIWIAERFTDEHRATLDWLNEITNDTFEFFGLEVELWRIGDSLAAPKFNVVSKPNDWSRSVGEIARDNNRNLTPTRSLQLAFWSALRKRLEETDSPIHVRKPRAQNWMGFSIGRAGFTLGGWLNSRDKWIAVYLDIYPPHVTPYFRLLEQQRKEIEQELGKLEWRPLPGQKSSMIRLRENADLVQEEDWPNQLDWMVSMLERFDQTFRSRVKSLDASAWRGDEGTAD